MRELRRLGETPEHKQIREQNSALRKLGEENPGKVKLATSEAKVKPRRFSLRSKKVEVVEVQAVSTGLGGHFIDSNRSAGKLVRQIGNVATVSNVPHYDLDGNFIQGNATVSSIGLEPTDLYGEEGAEKIRRHLKKKYGDDMYGMIQEASMIATALHGENEDRTRDMINKATGLDLEKEISYHQHQREMERMSAGKKGRKTSGQDTKDKDPYVERVDFKRALALGVLGVKAGWGNEVETTTVGHDWHIPGNKKGAPLITVRHEELAQGAANYDIHPETPAILKPIEGFMGKVLNKRWDPWFGKLHLVNSSGESVGAIAVKRPISKMKQMESLSQTVSLRNIPAHELISEYELEDLVPNAGSEQRGRRNVKDEEARNRARQATEIAGAVSDALNGFEMVRVTEGGMTRVELRKKR